MVCVFNCEAQIRGTKMFELVDSIPKNAEIKVVGVVVVAVMRYAI